MPIRDWPASERPREKLLLNGAQTLSDAEILAIFLRTGMRGKTAVDLARQLLADFGGLRPLLNADLSAFTTAPGLGPAKYAQLQAALEMGRRHLYESVIRGDAITSPEATRNYLSSRLRDQTREVFAILFLDNKHQVIAFEELFHGTVDAATVHPREVVKRALALNAAALIVAHNHPSGVCEPSRADLQITIRLRDALALVDIRLLDHLIVGDGVPLSLAERGEI
jgi:DNA repair protein RadC